MPSTKSFTVCVVELGMNMSNCNLAKFFLTVATSLDFLLLGVHHLCEDTKSFSTNPNKHLHAFT